MNGMSRVKRTFKNYWSVKIACFLLLFCFSSSLLAVDCVVLLHGLARTSSSLNKIQKALEQENYIVANRGYPSRSGTVEELAVPAVDSGISFCRQAGARQINFVTHSMGGILLRFYLESHDIENLHRVVMLAPPNQGSELVEVFSSIPGYGLLNGPAGLQLGTRPGSVPLQLGPVNFDLGIIAGNKTINLILSQFLENPDDGKVSVESTRVAGMCGFIEMPATHAMMMRNRKVIEQIIIYLASGRFSGEGAQSNLC